MRVCPETMDTLAASPTVGGLDGGNGWGCISGEQLSRGLLGSSDMDQWHAPSLNSAGWSGAEEEEEDEQEGTAPSAHDAAQPPNAATPGEG